MTPEELALDEGRGSCLPSQRRSVANAAAVTEKERGSSGPHVLSWKRHDITCSDVMMRPSTHETLHETPKDPFPPRHASMVGCLHHLGSQSQPPTLFWTAYQLFASRTFMSGMALRPGTSTWSCWSLSCVLLFLLPLRQSPAGRSRSDHPQSEAVSWATRTSCSNSHMLRDRVSSTCFS